MVPGLFLSCVISILTIAEISIGFGYSLCCTSHPYGLRSLERPFLPQADQKTFGSRPCPIEYTSHGFTTSYLWLTAWAAKIPITPCQQLGRITNHHSWFYANATPGSPPQPAEDPLGIKVHTIAHHIVAGSCQLVIQGVMGHHYIGLLCLAIEVSPGTRVMPPRCIARFTPRP